MEDILLLPEKIKKKNNWDPEEECVFYNFAWGGDEKLTDGSFQAQFNNATFSANALLAAKKIGCSKFINVGTMEETFAENYLKNPTNVSPPNRSQINYTCAKLASRDMCKILSYLEKIDYIHTRLSVPLSQSLDKGGYISSVFSKIKNNQSFDKPSNDQLFDIISLHDMAEAYYLIGKKGINNSDYFIGTSKPKKLNEYFKIFESILKGKSYKNTFSNEKDVDIMFSIDDLCKQTGFELSYTFEKIYKEYN